MQAPWRQIRTAIQYRKNAKNVLPATYVPKGVDNHSSTKSSRPTLNKSCRLYEVLEHGEARVALVAFCQNECSIENIQFLTACDKFFADHQLPSVTTIVKTKNHSVDVVSDPAKVARDFANIVNVFVRRDSICEINVSAAQRTQAQKLVDDPPLGECSVAMIEVLTDLALSIYFLIESDSLSRFKCTTEFARKK